MDLSGLNNIQKAVVQETQGPVLVLAGAGSGKTRVLTYRIAHLIEDMKVSPYNILAITFTNKAAKEMLDRVEKVCGSASGMWISTFHSLCSRILRYEIDKMPSVDDIKYDSNFSIYSESESKVVLSKILSNYQDLPDYILKSMRGIISRCKNFRKPIEEYVIDNAMTSARDIIKIYYEYNEELRKANALDFDDLLEKTIELFNSCPEMLNKYQERFKYIMIDEFQDTNDTQYKLVRLLGAKHNNVFAVGDEDQSIYGWRGANINNILSFKKDFVGTRMFKLEQNYRSTNMILKSANKLIEKNTERIGKTLFSENGDGVRIEYKYCGNDKEECEFVASQIYALHTKSGYEYSDIAVLMRLNALSRGFEQRLSAYGIPYQVYGGLKFYDRKEIKDFTAYLLLVCNTRDNVSFKRIINFPRRGIGDTTLAKLEVLATSYGLSMLDVIDYLPNDSGLNASTIAKLKSFKRMIEELKQVQEQLNLYDFVIELEKRVGIKNAYIGNTDEDESRRQNISEFISFVKEESDNNPNLKLNEFLQSMSLLSDLDDNNSVESSNGVKLSTVHSSKGLEFPVVFIVGMEEGSFPSSRSIDEGHLEEERRICYVAITRAMQRLYVTYAGVRFKFGRLENCMTSRFVQEMSDRIADNRQVLSSNVAGNQTGGEYVGSSFSVNRTPKETITQNAGKFRAGDKVEHSKFGQGRIIVIEGENIASIVFDKIGIKKLNIEIAPIKKIGE